jgi:hypothetical protein
MTDEAMSPLRRRTIEGHERSDLSPKTRQCCVCTAENVPVRYEETTIVLSDRSDEQLEQ